MKNKSLIFFYISILSMLFIQCQCGDGPTEPEGDQTAPTVLTVSPLNSAVDVLINTSMVIVFSEKLNATSVSNTTVTVANATSDVTFADSTTTVTFSPALSYSTTYTATITTEIADLAGNTLATDYTWSFTTEVDPATLPPMLVSRYPAHGAMMNNVTDSVTVSFTKEIDVTTLNDTTFYNTQGRTGTITYNSPLKTAIFHPTIPFLYDSLFEMTITSAIKDTDGNNLQSSYTWVFQTPTVTPQVSVFNPVDSLIIGDTITFIVAASNPIGIDTTQFYIDGVHVGVDNFNIGSSSSQFLLDASSYEIGSEHEMYAISYDSLGNFGYSDTITFFYLWELVMTDGNDDYNPLEVPNDLRKMYARSTDTTLELRYEYAVPWDSAYWDTTIDLAVFFDTDFSSSTGRRTAGGEALNDIGAEYRALIGVYRAGILDTVIHIWDPNCTDTVCWKGYKTFNDLYEFNIPNFSKTFEFGVKWSDLGMPLGADIVSINALFRNFNIDPSDVNKDYMPDRGNGHVQVLRRNRYIGPPSLIQSKVNSLLPKVSTSQNSSINNPFD